MYTSCAFFFEDLNRYEPRYAIANAVRALALTLYATGKDLSHNFRRDLRIADNKMDHTGATIFDEIVSRAEMEPKPPHSGNGTMRPQDDRA
jgi:hypothetical protein